MCIQWTNISWALTACWQCFESTQCSSLWHLPQRGHECVWPLHSWSLSIVDTKLSCLPVSGHRVLVVDHLSWISSIAERYQPVRKPFLPLWENTVAQTFLLWHQDFRPIFSWLAAPRVSVSLGSHFFLLYLSLLPSFALNWLWKPFLLCVARAEPERWTELIFFS